MNAATDLPKVGEPPAKWTPVCNRLTAKGSFADNTS